MMHDAPLPTLADILCELDRLPAFSEVVAQVLADRETAGSLKKQVPLLMRDPGLVARLLRIANSPFYGLAGRIASVDEALLVLGEQTTLSLLIALAAADAIRMPAEDTAVAADCWRHAFAAGTAAQRLAQPVGLRASAAFTAGLLHDIGQLLLLKCAPQAFALTGREARAACSSRETAENRLLGFTHATLGAALGRRWHFPATILEAIEAHHASGSEPIPNLANVVHVADVLCHVLDCGGVPDEPVPSLSQAAWEALRLEDRHVTEVMIAVRANAALGQILAMPSSN